MNKTDDNTPVPTTGKERAAARLAAKLAKNAEIPSVDTPPSRQVLRAAARSNEKARTRHMNEVVGRANVRTRRSYQFLNREQYRRFMSNRAPKALIAAVMTAQAELREAA